MPRLKSTRLYGGLECQQLNRPLTENSFYTYCQSSGAGETRTKYAKGPMSGHVPQMVPLRR